MKTVGISSKVLATSITAALAPVVVGFLADWIGADIDVATVTGIAGPVVLGLVTFAVGYLARADIVVDEDAEADEPVEDTEVPKEDAPFER